MHKSVYRYISLFFVTILLLARLSFVANSLLNAVFTFILPCLSIASRTRSRATFSASSKNRRGSMWLEFITAPVNIRLSNATSISHQTRDRCYSHTRHQCAWNVAPIATASRSILATTDCLCPTARRGRLARQSSSSCSMHSLQPRETPHQSSNLAALLQQFTFHWLIIFHVFSQF